MENSTFYDLFWSPSFWLPKGLSWDDMKSTPDVNMPNHLDLWSYPLIFGAILFLFRILIFNKIFHPLGQMLGLDDQPFKKEVDVESRDGSESERQVWNSQPGRTNSENIMTHRKNAIHVEISDENQSKRYGKNSHTTKSTAKTVQKVTGVQTPREKFCNVCFSLCFRVSFVCFGFYHLHHEPWVSDILECWRGYPYHSVSPGLWRFYMMGLSFYWSLNMWDLFRPPTKGIVAFYLHHLLTTVLIILSFISNITRAGALIFLYHDICDCFMEVSKLCIYFKLNRGLDVFFTITLSSWVYFRLIRYGGLITSSILDAHRYNFMPAAYLFFTLLIALYILDCIWCCMFFIAGFNRIKYGYFGTPKPEDMKNSKKEDNKYSDRNGRYERVRNETESDSINRISHGRVTNRSKNAYKELNGRKL